MLKGIYPYCGPRDGVDFKKRIVVVCVDLTGEHYFLQCSPVHLKWEDSFFYCAIGRAIMKKKIGFTVGGLVGGRKVVFDRDGKSAAS